MKKALSRLTWVASLMLLGGTSEAQPGCGETVQVRKVHSKSIRLLCQCVSSYDKEGKRCVDDQGNPSECVDCHWTATVTDEPPLPSECRPSVCDGCSGCEPICSEDGEQPGDGFLLAAAEEYPVTTTTNGQGGVFCASGLLTPDYRAFCDGIEPCLCFECAPSNLSATILPGGHVRLTWTDNSAGEEGFRIERRSGGGGFAVIQTVGADVTSAADSIAGCGLTHTYRVSGFSSSFESDASNWATVTVEGGNIAPTGAFFSADAAGGSVAVSGVEGCTWTAVSNDPWIVVAPGAGGSGDGTVQYGVDANPAASLRRGTMTIAGRTFTVTQAGLSCSYSIDPPGTSVGSEGGTGLVTVVTVPGCAWTASSTESWITLTSGESGTGPGTVSYSVTVNLDPAPRSGELQIAGQAFTVSQAGAPFCAFRIAPAGTTFPATGGAGNVSVTTTSSCTWTATSDDSWITVTGISSGNNNGGSTGTGSGSVTYAVAPTEGPRTGTLTIAGHTFSVTQEAGCTFALFPTGASVSSQGGTRAASVNAPAGCAWSASSNVPWIAVTSGNGTGNGTYLYVVAGNGGPERTGTLTVAGLTFTVTQAAPCSYSLKPGSASFSGAGGSGTFSVTAAPGCSWTAVSSVSWITVQAGNGSATVSYSVAANPAKTPRTGTVNVAGQAFTVTQGP
jgi:hypothetical protein